ncbi:MAG: 3'-5' exonuclease, partial [Bacteroidales bacterium]|nr:3'-5' exonuclease [Bacteroidales bacterium]
MNIDLKRPLLFFDIESTGLNIASDSIAELSFVKVFPGGEQRIKTWRVCPWDYYYGRQKPMDPRAREVNGISDEELADQPKFYEIVDEVLEWISDADLAGYNSAKFDLPLLAEEIERVKVWKKRPINVDLHSKQMVDVQVLYHKLEPRHLQAAHRFY